MVVRGISAKWLEISAYSVLGLGLVCPAHRAAGQPAAQDTRAQDPPPSQDTTDDFAQSRPGVVVTAPREVDRRTLEHVIVPRFVRSHATATDSKQVSKYSLTAIADYIGVLALTRASLDACNELPSVIDLLSKDCEQGRATPTSLTSADAAYLKALYSANLGYNVNIELGEVRQRMAEQIEAE
jgi:hypothetical protein